MGLRLGKIGLLGGLTVFVIGHGGSTSAQAFETCQLTNDPSQIARCQSPALQALERDLEIVRDRAVMIETLNDPFRFKQQAARTQAANFTSKLKACAGELACLEAAYKTEIHFFGNTLATRGVDLAVLKKESEQVKIPLGTTRVPPPEPPPPSANLLMNDPSPSAAINPAGQPQLGLNNLGAALQALNGLTALQSSGLLPPGINGQQGLVDPRGANRLPNQMLQSQDQIEAVQGAQGVPGAQGMSGAQGRPNLVPAAPVVPAGVNGQATGAPAAGLVPAAVTPAAPAAASNPASAVRATTPSTANTPAAATPATPVAAAPVAAAPVAAVTPAAAAPAAAAPAARTTPPAAAATPTAAATSAPAATPAR